MDGLQRLFVSVSAALLVLAVSGSASAREKYLEQFRSLYTREFSGNDEATKCSVCHSGPVKRSRNRYGKAMNEALTGRNVRDKEKIREALEEIESKPSEINGKTFGQLIREGKLPGK